MVDLVARTYILHNSLLKCNAELKNPTPSFGTSFPELQTRIPQQADWVDYGTIIEAGGEGEWDYYLWGGFAFSVIKKDDTYLLYYQGSSDYRTEYDETVLWRAIGVATSRDGIHFTKYEEQSDSHMVPKSIWRRGSRILRGDIGTNKGKRSLFYGANTQESPTSVNADVRVASSVDGFNFTDLGIALDRNERFCLGWRRRVVSRDAIYDSGRWIVYYIPNGTSESGYARRGVWKSIRCTYTILSSDKQ